ncbi:MAG: precorrin-4 C(11)-methyltransferase [Tissierellia bacterium]|nr:precorrin-4 C(11)-methyltransferase [Tissierellia bacterium]
MIYFVGAGPGDVDLITVKGRRLLEEADLIIYAGSLVSEAHLAFAKPSCKFYNSAKMNLDEVLEVMTGAEKEGLMTVRLHTGDPSIYGAIQEQMDALEEGGLPFEVVPGVSSFTAAAAAIKHEFTLPEVSQTLILTRRRGRTSVPEKENIPSLASHGASMAIFLSVGSIEELVEELKEGYGRDDVPVAVVYRASWEDEKQIFGTLADIAGKVKDEKVVRQAQILVGDFLKADYAKSKLYDKGFTTGYRQGQK